MSDIIKIYVKQIEQSSEPDLFRLDKITAAGNNLYLFNESPIISLGSGSYDFEMKVYLEEPNSVPEYKHTIIVSQDESDETIKPGLPQDNRKLSLPNEVEALAVKLTSPSQDESDETIKPGEFPDNKKII